MVAAALAPAAWLAVSALRGTLGANPVETLEHTTGQWTLRLLLATLAVTPLRRAFGWAWLAPCRRTLGLLAFGYCCLHLCVYALVDLWGAWDTLIEDVLERPYITAGFTGFLLLLPLAITSTRAWMRRLGRRWVVLHRLVYAAAVAGCLHFLWLVKADVLEPLVYAGVLALLLGARVWPYLRRAFAPA
ncbi:MAG: protein-methionine-sulfoxide reductase heme-binding subunit MsrQ [Myxococcota bacterium]